jgi:hypothetical protein
MCGQAQTIVPKWGQAQTIVPVWGQPEPSVSPPNTDVTVSPASRYHALARRDVLLMRGARTLVRIVTCLQKQEYAYTAETLNAVSKKCSATSYEPERYSWQLLPCRVAVLLLLVYIVSLFLNILSTPVHRFAYTRPSFLSAESGLKTETVCFFETLVIYLPVYTSS